MFLTVFRSRLREEAQSEYTQVAGRMNELVASMPGYVRHKTFVADDGERVTICEFESEHAIEAWSENVEHEDAKARGIAAFYGEYRIQVCEVRRTREFAGDATGRRGA